MIPAALFRLFLRKESIVTRLDRNKRMQGYGDNKMAIYRDEEPIDYLVSQFDFSKSIEGFDFWNSINERWLDFYESNIK